MVQHCEKCLMNCRQNQKEPDIPIEIPIVAWKVVASDLLVFNGKTFILVVDLFSRFPVIRRLAGGSSCVVLEAITDILCDFGMPETIIIDNGPCYKSKEFLNFCARFEIEHIIGSAYNHQANAIAERSIQTIKNLMAKNPRDVWLALLIFKSTPITGIDKSPSELLCNQKFRTNLPMIQHASELANKARLKLLKTNVNTGKGKDLLPISIGSRVIYDSNPDHRTKRPEWSKGTITDISGPGRKYTILSDDTGHILTRTRRDIRPNKTSEYVTKSSRISKPPDRLTITM